MSGVGNVPGGANQAPTPASQPGQQPDSRAAAAPTSGSTGASPSGAPAAPTGSGDVGAMLADAGVVVPTSDFDTAADVGGSGRAREMNVDTESDVVESRPRPMQKEDRRETRDAKPVQDRSVQENPFENARKPVRDAAAHDLGEPVDVDTEIDLPPKILGKLMGFAAELTGKGEFEKALPKLLDGALLVDDDAQEAGVRSGDHSRADARKVAHEVRSLAAKQQAIKVAKLKEMLRLARLGNNPQAFVQRVMRESYAIGNEIMRDFAERMKKANELREAIRKEAQRTREAISANAGKESTDALRQPFEMKDIDSARMEVVNAFYSVQDAEEAMADTAVEVGPGQEIPPWDKPDALSKGERLSLQKWAEDDDDIEDNLDRIKDFAGRVSVSEFHEYIYPLMVRLAVYDDEDELVELLEALPPYLRLTSVAQKIGEAPRGKRSAVGAAVAQGAAVGAVAAGSTALVATSPAAMSALAGLTATGVTTSAFLAAAPFAGLGVAAAAGVAIAYGLYGSRMKDWSGKSIREALTGSESDEYELLRNDALDELAHHSGVDVHGIWLSEGADAALAAYEEAMLSPPSGEDDDLDPARMIEAGARKAAHTVGELKDYEKYLEDQLNSVGEDAQLMNVELQNQLQKQQQLLQMMSNMSKALHDAAMSIVRKLEG